MDDGREEGGGETDADDAAGTDGVGSDVAGRGVEEAAVGEELDGLMGLKGQPALGAVGNRLVGVVEIVPILEGGDVEVVATKDGIGVVVAGGPASYLATAEELEVERVGSHDCLLSVFFFLFRNPISGLVFYDSDKPAAVVVVVVARLDLWLARFQSRGRSWRRERKQRVSSSSSPSSPYRIVHRLCAKRQLPGMILFRKKKKGQ